MPKRHQSSIILLTLCLSAICPAKAQQLLINGDFETGTFTGWTLTNQSNPFDMTASSHFYIGTPGANTPAINGSTFSTAANPLGGLYYAVSASDVPGAHALMQNFTVPSNTTNLTLTFQMFVTDQSGIGPFIDPTGLDYTTGGLAQPNDNQHARVDILRANAGDLSTAATDIVDNLYLNVDPSKFDETGNLSPNPYLSYSADLTGILTPGSTYRIRFAEVDNDSALNMGLDNISIRATPTTPEPGNFTLLMGLCISSSLLLSRRRHTSTPKIVIR